MDKKLVLAVVMDGVESCVLPVVSDVPRMQAGLLLFLIYIDKVSQAITSCKLEIYADNIVMYKRVQFFVNTKGNPSTGKCFEEMQWALTLSRL